MTAFVADGTDVERVSAADEVLRCIATEVLEGFGVEGALRRLAEHGAPGHVGIDEIRRELGELRRGVATGPAQRLLAQLAAEVEAAVALERTARAAEGDARGCAELDLLPSDAVTRFETVRFFEWSSPLARARYEQIRVRVEREAIQMQYAVLQDGLSTTGPAQLDELTELILELNRMLAQPTYRDGSRFASLMREHTPHLVDVPESLDELLIVVARRLAAVSRLLASMAPEHAEQLRALLDGIFDDPDFQLELLKLEARLRRLVPGLPWDSTDLPAGGGETGSVAELLDRIERLGPLHELDAQLASFADALEQRSWAGSLDEVALEAALGPDAVEAVRKIGSARTTLLDSGAVRFNGEELVLSARGARMLGAQALRDLRSQPPLVASHRWRRGAGADSQSRRDMRVDPVASLRQAALRQAFAGHRLGGQIALQECDIERRSDAELDCGVAIVLLVDLSYSMQLHGHLVPTKRAALALHELVEHRGRACELHIVGFSNVARQLSPEGVVTGGFERVEAANMQEGLALAGKLLRRAEQPRRQVLMITDGAPTAHDEQDTASFVGPPSAETIQRTLREASRLARAAITLDVLLLESDPSLMAFGRRLVGAGGGTVQTTSGDALGQHVIAALD